MEPDFPPTACERELDPRWTRMASRAARIKLDLLIAAEDVLALCVCVVAGLLLRYDGAVSANAWHRVAMFLPVAAVTVLFTNWLCGLYGQIWQFASVVEARRVMLAGLAAAVALTGIVVLGPRLVPVSTAIAAAVMYTLLLGATRFQSRLFRLTRRVDAGAGLRVAVVGAGGMGATLVRQMLTTAKSGMLPVAVLDDDPRQQGRTILGVRVLGPVEMLPELARDHGIHQVVLAVETASRELVRRVADAAERCELPLRVVPDISALMAHRVRLEDLRALQIEDLLGRQQVATDLAAVEQLIAGRRVLITGAGGSIGAEICRQAASFGPAELLLLDHDETHLHDVAATLRGTCTLLLADIRNPDLLLRLFRRHRPDLVFHAAAHKHVPLLETHPAEALETNVNGTQNVVAAATAVGVQRLVFISTDKAVHPKSVMGATKRIAEDIVLAGTRGETRRCAVRFGNVVGSRGSVVPTFLSQIEAGGPVTVTHPRMTRFFMSIPEAVQLVLQAATMSEGGEIFMLEMGEPVRILQLAHRMIRLSGRRAGLDVPVRITGMRPGEKLVEELRVPAERAEATSHPSIVRLHPLLPHQRTLDAALDRLESLKLGNDHLRTELLRVAGDGSDGGLARSPAGAESTIDLTETAVIDLTEDEVWSPSTI